MQPAPDHPTVARLRVRRAALSALTPLCLLAALSLPFSAAADTPADLAGHWVLDRSADPAAVVHAEIDRVLAQVIAPVRWVARPMIEQATEPAPTMTLSFGDDEVTVQAGEVSWSSDLSRTLVDGRLPDKSKVKYRRWLDDGALVAEGIASTGTSTYRFRTDPTTGLLRLSVVVESKHLPDQLRYTLSYRRSD